LQFKVKAPSCETELKIMNKSWKIAKQEDRQRKGLAYREMKMNTEDKSEGKTMNIKGRLT